VLSACGSRAEPTSLQVEGVKLGVRRHSLSPHRPITLMCFCMCCSVSLRLFVSVLSVCIPVRMPLSMHDERRPMLELAHSMQVSFLPHHPPSHVSSDHCAAGCRCRSKALSCLRWMSHSHLLTQARLQSVGQS